MSHARPFIIALMCLIFGCTSLTKTIQISFPNLKEDLNVVYKGMGIHNTSAYARETIYTFSLYGDSTYVFDYQYLVLTKILGHRPDGRPIEQVCDALRLPQKKESRFMLCLCDNMTDGNQKTYGVFVSQQQIDIVPQHYYLETGYTVDTLNSRIIRIKNKELRCENIDWGI